MPSISSTRATAWATSTIGTPTNQHPHKLDGLIRKVSFSLFLNADYEGGELDLEVGSPRLENRCATFKSKPGTMLFFVAETWHRVRPVTSGFASRLVGWYLGPPYV